MNLGKNSKKNQWLFNLLQITKSGVKEIKPVLTLWKNLIDVDFSDEEVHKLFGSLLALVSYAKEKSGSRFFPFLYLQITYWLRSLNRIVRKLQPNPVFEWESDVNPNDPIVSLPPYFCRECGGSGWVGIKKELSTSFEDDLSRTRSLLVGDRQNRNIYFVSSLHDKNPNDVFANDYTYTGDAIDGYIHPHSFEIFDRKESDEQFKIFGVRNVNGNNIDKICPHCNSRNTIALIGTGVPTIESVATAQILATSTDQTPDEYRKLLAFTNGVQDAAHQAGFIENRNFTFGMRHAIQSILNDEDDPVTLDELSKKFESYWKNKIDPTGKKLDAYYHKFLPPDCQSRVDLDEDKEWRNADNTFKLKFDKEFSNRMTWEIWSEFSFRAIIGRTLEKSGASGVFFPQDELEEVYDQMTYWLNQNELGTRIEKDTFLKFLNGFLHRLRTKGGVDHLYLKKYRTERTNYWLITQNVNKKFFLMRNFGRNSRLPKFLTLSHGRNTAAFDVVQANNKHNWFTTYFLKSFPLVAREELELINDFYAQLLEYLDSNNVLDKKVASGVTNYGLAQDKILVRNKAKTFSCNRCGHQIHVAADGASLANEMKCLQYNCGGHYLIDKDLEMDYYRMVYNRGRSTRIFAKDHTGLIDRDKREFIENDFKEQPSYKSTNVLVATSTLEMGIDIGDLNITFNSSLPPETANYLQRVGRAGRSSGTSLILNLAGRDEHDLYYFQDPMDMMNGMIRTPSCYLEAKDILRRHFMAFCFDSWATIDPENNRIPPMIRALRLKSLHVGDPKFVFNQISQYIDSNKSSLYLNFLEQYKYDIGEDSESLTVIQEDLTSGRFTKPLLDIHQNLLDEIGYYSKKQSSVRKQLSKLPKTGSETENLKMELRALGGAIYNINQRNVIEHLTNIGILPNYAFPETGVGLNAQIRRKKEIDGKVEYKYDNFGEIVRPGSSALTELAPANVFYSQGFKLEAQGLEIRSNDDYELQSVLW